MIVLKITLLTACLAAASAQQYGPTTTPVPILKQINKQNDDGSYSFGYEAADGSFKIETKYPNGDVAGKYGYVDAEGKTREVSYGAGSKRGFEPQGTGIMVPPPTLNDPPTNALTDGQEDDGQYREDPSIYEDPKYNSRSQKSRPGQGFRSYQTEPQYQTQVQQPAQPRYQPQPQPQPQPNFQDSFFSQSPQQFPRPQSQIYHQQPQFSYQAYTPQQNYQPQQSFQPQPTYQPQPAYQPQQAYQPQYQNYQNHNPFLGHPATNFDPSTGSYTINFTG
ncbi:hypothetical protein JYU34_008533 [Plutella xylostella]|uniref:Cuticular protein n=1 Tax=Plutella xylostella TaxID=51655 RepID=A0ABQ7QL60_PLUXY|nr:hypothetical protein JYU34_008533 [Plutella xylostella]